MEKKLGKLDIKERSEIIQTTALAKIGEDSQKSPEEPKRLAVTQISVKKQQFEMVGKTRKE